MPVFSTLFGLNVCTDQVSTGYFFYKKWAIHGIFLFIFVYSIQLILNKCSTYFCRLLDSNRRLLVLEVTAVPTETQPLPNTRYFLPRVPASLGDPTFKQSQMILSKEDRLKQFWKDLLKFSSDSFASNTRDLQFESSHQQFLFYVNGTGKTNIKNKEAGNGQTLRIQ